MLYKSSKLNIGTAPVPFLIKCEACEFQHYALLLLTFCSLTWESICCGAFKDQIPHSACDIYVSSMATIHMEKDCLKITLQKKIRYSILHGSGLRLAGKKECAYIFFFSEQAFLSIQLTEKSILQGFHTGTYFF